MQEWQVAEILLHKNNYIPTLGTQYHGCMCTGDARHQGISSHGILLLSWFLMVFQWSNRVGFIQNGERGLGISWNPGGHTT